MRDLGMRHAAGMAGLVLALAGGMLSPAHAHAAEGGLASRPAQGAADPAVLNMTASLSPSPLVVGETAVYTVTVRNTGDAAATNVTTTLPFTPGNTLTVGSPLPAGCTSAGQTVTCTEPTIPPGGSVTYSIPVTVLPSVSDGTNIALRATATAAGGVTASTDLITQAFTRVDVEIDKTGPATVSPGGTITYTITVTNHGPSDAATVTWHDPTDGNLTTITSYPCSNTGLTVTCDLGTMTPGETRTFPLTVTVNPSVPVGTVISNCAIVYTGTSPETNPDNNQSCTDTTVNPTVPPVSRIEVKKTAPAVVEEGGVINYSVTVTNRGPDPAANVVISDPLTPPVDTVTSLPADCTLQDNTVTCQAGTLAVGESQTFTFSVKVPATVPPGTNIMNCASVTSRHNRLLRTSRPYCAQTLVVPVPKPTATLEIAKTGPATVHPGDTVTYTITVTNKGPGGAIGVVVTDPTDRPKVTVTGLPHGCSLVGGTITCDEGTVRPGQTKTFHVTVKVGPDVRPGTHVVNCASVASRTSLRNRSGRRSCTRATVVSRPAVPVTG